MDSTTQSKFSQIHGLLILLALGFFLGAVGALGGCDRAPDGGQRCKWIYLDALDVACDPHGVDCHRVLSCHRLEDAPDMARGIVQPRLYPDMGTVPDMISALDMSPAADMTLASDGSVPAFCDYNQNCTFSYGYWKQHWVCSVDDLTLGTVHYTNVQLLAILSESVNSNGLVDLAHQLIGVKMNIIKGADSSSIQSTIDAADALIGPLVVPPVGSDSLTTAQVATLATTLANYNLGQLGPGHCN